MDKGAVKPITLIEIRERDARWLPHRQQNSVADYDRRELLRLIDAKSKECEAMRAIAMDAVHRVKWMLQYVRDMDMADVERDVMRFDAALKPAGEGAKSHG